MQTTLKGKPMNECYISVDIEATGPTPGHYSMYELGACVVGEMHTFERKLTLLKDAQYSIDSLRAVGTSMSKLLRRKDVVSTAVALCEFATWTQEVARSRRIVFVANNAPFDWMFVAWYFKEFNVENPFGHSALDMKAYFMGLTKCTWEEATLATMAKYAGIEFKTLPHRALHDALVQAEIFTKLLYLK